MMKKTILAIAAMAVVGAVAFSLFFLMRGRTSDDRRGDGAYRAGLAENVEAQRSAAREAARLRRELDGVDFAALAARREAAGEEEKTAIDAMLAKRARAERLEREVARLQNEARRTVAARRQRETAAREGL